MILGVRRIDEAAASSAILVTGELSSGVARRCLRGPYCVTARMAVPEIVPDVAVIVTWTGRFTNGPFICASPAVAAELLMLTFGLLVDHTTASVISALPPPTKLPVALNGTVWPVIALVLDGET